MIKLIKALYRRIAYSVSMGIAYNKALNALKPGTLFARQEAWILYVTYHSTISYTEAVKIYNLCTKLPMKFNRRNAKLLTNLIMQIAACGCSPTCALSDIVIGETAGR